LAFFLLALIPIFVAGFWIPYLSEFPQFDASITWAVHVHAVLLFVWVGLLIIQPLSVHYKAFSLHRTLGSISYVLMPLIVIFATAMIWKEYQEKVAAGFETSFARNAEFLSAAQLVLVAVFYALAIAAIRTRDAGTHMRYMICIGLFLLPAGLARVLGYWFRIRQVSSQTVCLIVIELVLVFLIGYNLRRRQNAKPFVIAFVAYTVSELFWIAAGRPV